MALLSHPLFQRPAIVRVRSALASRPVLGIGYAVAAALTSLAILLAAYPPVVGPLGPLSRVILMVLGLNLALILGLLAAVSLRIVALLRVRAQDAGARLHLRFVWLFSLAALVPALVIAIFYGVLVNQGVERWFSDRARTRNRSSHRVRRPAWRPAPGQGRHRCSLM